MNKDSISIAASIPKDSKGVVNLENGNDTKLTMGDAWNHFIKINVSPWVEKKGKFDYLKWQMCWYLVKEADPEASFYFKPMITDQEVECVITIFGYTNEMHMPVLNFSNKPIENPTSMDINTAKMRCMVKGVAVHWGLGFHVYHGLKTPEQLIKIGDGTAAKVDSPSTNIFTPVNGSGRSTNLAGVSSAPVAAAKGSASNRALPLPPARGGKA